MDIIKLFEDNGIDYKTEGHKHCRPGWVNTACPFCTGNPGYHLGFPLDGHVFVCYRCGKHGITNTVSKLLGISYKESAKLVREYKGPAVSTDHKIKLKKKAFKYPSNTGPLTAKQKNYLAGRGFDPDYLEEHYGLLGTGHYSKLDKIDYKHRIIIPIYWNNEVVSFQGRQIKKEVDKADVKYKACPQIREKIQHKHIVYASPKNWEILKGSTGICVEGVTDVWKLGDFAFAVFGIKYRKEQVRVMRKHFKRIAVVFDDDPQAIKQAETLVEQLKWYGVEAWRVPVVNDPGSMSYDDAKHLVNGIVKKIY